MKWLDLYNFLHSKAHDFQNLESNGSFWNQHIVVYNVETGDEYSCDTIEFNKTWVLAINHELLKISQK